MHWRPRRDSLLVRWIKKWRMAWAAVTVVFYVIAFPLTVVLFPANSLWLALVVLFSGLTGAMTTLADLLVNAEDS